MKFVIVLSFCLKFYIATLDESHFNEHLLNGSFILQRNKFVAEGKLLMGQISRLEDLLSSKKKILQVVLTFNRGICFLT